MTAKALVKAKGKHSIIVTATKGQSYDEAVAKKLTRPEVQASLTIQKLHPINDVNALTTILGQQTADVIDGSMVRPESMLLAQAHTLDALFNSLVMHHYRKPLEDAGTSCLTINIQWNMGSMFGVFSRKKKANGQPDNTGQNRTKPDKTGQVVRSSSVPDKNKQPAWLKRLTKLTGKIIDF